MNKMYPNPSGHCHRPYVNLDHPCHHHYSGCHAHGHHHHFVARVVPIFARPHLFDPTKTECECNRPILRDEQVGNIIKVESKIVQSLSLKLYSCIADNDVEVKIEIGNKYQIKYITELGVINCTGIVKDLKAAQLSETDQYTNANGYYLVVDCSTEGQSMVHNILISSIRDIIEVVDVEDFATTFNETQIEAINNMLSDIETENSIVKEEATVLNNDNKLVEYLDTYMVNIE